MNVSALPKWVRTVIKASVYYPLASIVALPYRSRSPRFRKLLFDAVNYASPSLLHANMGREQYIIDARDRVIGVSVFTTGEFEFHKVELVCKILGRDCADNPFSMLIDAGANIGTVCIPAVARGFARAAVAIEPYPENCNLLSANIALNGLSKKISVIQSALDETVGKTLDFELSESNFGDHRVRTTDEPGALNEQTRRVVTVQSTTLDLAASADPDALVWMDVQGYEGHVLAGANSWLRAGAPFCVEFWPYALKRTGSFGNLKHAFQDYAGFYDLGTPHAFQRMSELDAVYERLGELGASTDLLFVRTT